jgi:hypothetical protein
MSKIPNKSWTILLVVLLSSCSLFYEPIIPSDVEPYVDEFIYEGVKRGTKVNKDRIKIRFRSISPAMGTGCYCLSGRYLITIDHRWYDENAWTNDRLEPWEKRWLIFHELGHAALNRGHKNHKINYVLDPPMNTDGTVNGFYRYASIMAEGKMRIMVGLQRNYFEEFYSEYMDEMFE